MNNNMSRLVQPVKVRIKNKNVDEHDESTNVKLRDQIQPWTIPRGQTIKYIDTSISFAGVAATWGIVDISAIASGTGSSNKLGTVVDIIGLSLNFDLVALNSDIFTAVQWAVVQWTQESASLPPSGSLIFQTNNSPYSFSNWDNTRMYRILERRTLAMAGTSTNPTNSGYQWVSVNIDLSSAAKRMIFVSGSTSGTNKLYFFVISTSAIAPFPVMTGNARLVFSDA